MEAANIEKLLLQLGCMKIKQGYNAWVNATCPLAQWKHRGGHDENPSFGVSIEPGGASKYKCHSCGTSGELSYLIWSVARYSKRDLSALMSFVQMFNAPSAAELLRRSEAAKSWSAERPRPVAGISVTADSLERKVAVPELITLPESDLKPFQNMPDFILDYLTGSDRRLTPETIKEWELGWHGGVRRVAIPIRDVTGALVGISGRAFDEGQKPKYMHSSGFRGAFYLYGENRIRKNVRGILVEGFFDVMYLHQRGYNAVGMHGAHVSPFQIQKLKEFFSEILIFPDGDEPGYQAANKAVGPINQALPAKIATATHGKDPDQYSDDELIEILGPPDW